MTVLGDLSGVRHYTRSRFVELIKAEGLKPGANSGKLWLTPDVFDEPEAAQARLALPERPDGWFEIPVDRLPKATDKPSLVEPGFGRDGTVLPGGGLEIVVTEPIDVSGLEFNMWEEPDSQPEAE